MPEERIKCERKVAELEQKVKNNTDKIARLEKVTDSIHSMSENLVILTNEMKHTSESIHDLKVKVDEIEHEPLQNIRDSRKAFIGAFLGVIGSGLALVIIFELAKYVQ